MPPTDSKVDPLSADIEATVGRCAGAVRSVASGHGLFGADVDAVFQEVRIRLWRALETGDRIASVPASYVYRTAVSSALDIIRRRRSQPIGEPHATSADVEIALVADSDPATDLARSEAMSRVMEAVRELGESRRPVVRMHLTGYKLSEIADLLGWSEAKTRNLLYRGLDDLRTALRGLGVNAGELK